MVRQLKNVLSKLFATQVDGRLPICLSKAQDLQLHHVAFQMHTAGHVVIAIRYVIN